MRVAPDFTELLVGRLRRRVDNGRPSYFLDCRDRRFGSLGKLAVREVGLPGWPNVGAAVRDEATARRLVREHYALYLARELRVRTAAGVPTPSVRAACAAYLNHASRELGPAHNTVRNRAAALRRHVIAVVGDEPLAHVSRERMQRILDDMQLPAANGGLADGGSTSVRQATARPAKRGTKKALLLAIRAVWKHAFPDEPHPYTNLRLDPPPPPAAPTALRSPSVAGTSVQPLPPRGGPNAGGLDSDTEHRSDPEHERTRASSDEEWDDIDPDDHAAAYTPEAVTRILTAAMDLDLSERAARPNQQAWSVPNSAGLIAVEICTGMRVSEIGAWTWGHIKPKHGAARATDGIHGKTEAAHRWFPLQVALEPWLRLLWNQQRDLNGEQDPRPHDLVIRATPGRPAGRASRRTLQGRITRALVHAGLKRPGCATHIFRASHISWGALSGAVSVPLLKAFVGHESAFGGATDRYVKVLRALLSSQHREYISIPTPAEIHAGLKDFTPGPVARTASRHERYVPPEHPGAAVPFIRSNTISCLRSA